MSLLRKSKIKVQKSKLQIKNTSLRTTPKFRGSEAIPLNSPLYGKVLLNEPLSLHTSIKVGGPASIWIEPDTLKQLLEIVKLSKMEKISIFTIGEGCNIIVAGTGIDGICVKLNTPAFKKIEFNGAFVRTGAGVLLNELLTLAGQSGLGGYEFLAGTPGTVGGAIFANAGSKDETISSLLKEIEVVGPNGKLKRIKRKNIKFGYRKSGLEGNIVVSAVFKFKKADRKNTRALLRKNLIKKIHTQDYTAPSAGCIFKNPIGSRFSAGELIDRCGLKGSICGGAQISKRHANFIINKNNAKAEDIFSLIKLIKNKVKAGYGIKLEEEVKIIE